MGDTRYVDGVIEHEESRGVWKRIVIDDCGKPLPVCLHGEEPQAVIDETTGQIVMELGGVAVSMEPAMAAQWADELARIVAPSSEAKLSAEYQARVEQYRGKAADERQLIEADMAARREELTQLAQAVEELRAAHGRLDAEIAQKRGEA